MNHGAIVKGDMTIIALSSRSALWPSSVSILSCKNVFQAAKEGLSLAFFPEGTFREERGVGRFRPGAFVAAVRGGMPVIPVAISGSRDMLPMGHALPRPRRLRIDILEPIRPDDPAFADHRQLGETARQRILAVLDEPNLLADDPLENQG